MQPGFDVVPRHGGHDITGRTGADVFASPRSAAQSGNDGVVISQRAVNDILVEDITNNDIEIGIAARCAFDGGRIAHDGSDAMTLAQPFRDQRAPCSASFDSSRWK